MNGMIAQVHSLPTLLEEVFHTLDEDVRVALDHELCLSVKRMYVTGCGDSYHAALSTEMAVESLAGLPVEAMTALQYSRYTAGFQPKAAPKMILAIGISVSGTVARTAEALTMARQAGATTMALTATPESRVAQAAEIVLIARAPEFQDPEGEIVPGVRTYFINQLALILIAVRLGEVRGKLTSMEAAGMRQEIRELAEAAEKTISACDGAAKALAEDWADAREFVFVGGGPNYGTALFSAAKILEASGDYALGQDTEEWCHLQYFAREKNAPTFFITAGERDLSRATEAAVAAKKIGRRVAAITPVTAKDMAAVADRTLPLVKVREMFSPLIAAIPVELFAAYRAEVVGEPFFRAFSGGRSIKEGGGISRIQSSEVWDSWQ